MRWSTDPKPERGLVATIVIVPGGFVGGWFYERLVGQLGEAGHAASAPTLTGLAERAYQATSDTDLSEHVRDVPVEPTARLPRRVRLPRPRGRLALPRPRPCPRRALHSAWRGGGRPP